MRGLAAPAATGMSLRPGDFEKAQGVRKSEGERDVAGNGSDGFDLEFRGAQGQEEGDGVIDSGIGIEDDALRFGGIRGIARQWIFRRLRRVRRERRGVRQRRALLRMREESRDGYSKRFWSA